MNVRVFLSVVYQEASDWFAIALGERVLARIVN